MTHKPKIELVYDADCPNVERARTAIQTALATLDITGEWQEWERGVETTPAELRKLGSPTVLVNGKDVGSDDGGIAPADANSCRVYRSEDGRTAGAPSAEVIVRAIVGQR